jgi:hypothetical protein
MMKLAQQKHPDVIMRAPFMGSWLSVELVDLLWLVLLVHGKVNMGPLTRVIIIAPPTVTIVPNIFAWL